MKLLKDIIVDFCLFSLIEGWILTQFYEKICNCRKFKWYEILILSFINCTISQVFVPVIYQILIIIILSVILYYKENYTFIKCIKNSILSMLFILITEMSYGMLCEILFKINFINLSKISLFNFMIPIRLIQYLLIKGSENNETLDG